MPLRGIRPSFLHLLLLGLLIALGTAQAIPVDLELALLVDVSGSVNGSEFATQRDGYAAAFIDPGLIDAVVSGDIGAIAVSFWYWSGSTQQQQAVGWTLIHDAASAAAFSTSIASAARPFFGATAPGSAINAVFPTFATNGFEGTFQKMDVSGDGTQNSGASTPGAVQAALAAGIDQVNGLPIGSQALIDWYAANVVGGAGAFNQPAGSFADFQPALLTKLEREITESSPVPEPGTLVLFGVGLTFVAFRLRRKG